MGSARLKLDRPRDLSDWDLAEGVDLYHTVEVFLKHQAGATAAVTEWLHEILSTKTEIKEKSA